MPFTLGSRAPENGFGKGFGGGSGIRIQLSLSDGVGIRPADERSNPCAPRRARRSVGPDAKIGIGRRSLAPALVVHRAHLVAVDIGGAQQVAQRIAGVIKIVQKRIGNLDDVTGKEECERAALRSRLYVCHTSPPPSLHISFMVQAMRGWSHLALPKTNYRRFGNGRLIGKALPIS